ncbi:ACT domain-containing protein [Formosa sediminum]|uniref:ACT domain-containing protein n=1 Tax=Formosa sediminum TaxID=2594004 RepID=A0A516GQV6_9FLAO|nr:ACT domain-containing protein [Formosa sediminum]QDO93917.1 ACT domain-containing protein [Formosa sediminum]
MAGEINLRKLIRQMTPILNHGYYVFVTVKDVSVISREDTICEFKEKEGTTIVIDKNKADSLGFKYDFIAAWITLKIHSSLEAVGLTAVFSTELAKHDISCNVIAGYYHDHIFVAKEDSSKAFKVLTSLSLNY